jgi:monovalent cation/hydrogen antiporter
LGLAIGLVIASIFAVAIVTKAVVNEPIPWSVAFVLPTNVAPPDAVAGMAVTPRLKAPHRVVSVLEGETPPAVFRRGKWLDPR